MSLREHRRPLSPEAAAVVRAQLATARGAAVRRRSFLAGAGALGAGAALSACGTGPGSDASARPEPAEDRSDTDRRVSWANWTLYLDYDSESKTYPTLEEFTRTTGIQADYSEDIDDNDTYYGKIQGQLKNGQDIGRDIVVFTDHMAARVIRQGYAQRLDKKNISNADNILDGLRQVDFDAGRNYSLTWQGGFAVLAWNKAKVPNGLRTVQDLWRPELRGRVEVLSEMRDTIGLIMLAQGVDISGKFTSEQFGKALEVLEQQLNNGQIRQVKGNSYKEDLVSEDALAVIGWSGDITQLNMENGDKWGYAVPESGCTQWSDNMLIPIGSPHKQNAEILMNYYYEPEVAAEVAAYVNYVCPVKGAREAMEKIDPDLVDNPLIFPSGEYAEKAYVFRTLEPAEETEFSSQFQEVLGA